MAIVLIDELEDLVKDSKRSEWLEKKKLWFVIDGSDAKDLRYPGKMKLEWESSNGAMIALVMN